MFKIRREQKDAFRTEELYDFEARVADHLRRCFPQRWAALGEDAGRALIRHGIEGASRHGIVTERDVCKFVDLALVFGVDFDRERAWAREILAGVDPRDPSAKLRRLHERAMEEA